MAGKVADKSDGTVGKALDVLDQVAAFGRPVRFTELLDQCPYPKATLYRFLQTLVSQGMLVFDRERQSYALGLRLVRLAHAAWRQFSLATVARPWLDRLAEHSGETVHLAQLDHGQVLYVDKRNARRPIRMFSDAGKVGPAYCTGVGKAMLAFLPEDELEPLLRLQSFHRFTPNTITTVDGLRSELTRIRARGHAYDDEEHEPGIICVAAPILSHGGSVIGGLSLTSSTDRMRLAELGELAPDVRATARAIADEAEDWRFPEGPRLMKAAGG